MAASMTLDLGNTDKLAIFKQDMDKLKIPLYQPDVNASHPTFTVKGEGVRYALGALKGVGEAAMEASVTERDANGAYKTLEDYVGWLDAKSMNKRQFERMVGRRAFDALNDNNRARGGERGQFLRHAQSLAAEKESGQVSLFGAPESGGGLGLPDLPVMPRWSALSAWRRSLRRLILPIRPPAG